MDHPLILLLALHSFIPFNSLPADETGDGNDGISDDDGAPNDISPEDLARDAAKRERKKAGIPELELDGLPSALCNKMSTLSTISLGSFKCFPRRY